MKSALLSVALALSAATLSAQPKISGITNAANGAATIAGGSWISVWGSGLSTTTRPWAVLDFSGSTLPTSLDNVTVTIGGKKAAISYISPGQLNVQAPTGLADGPVTVEVANLTGSASGTATIAAYSPAFFRLAQKFVAAVHNADGAYVLGADALSGVRSRPAVPGEIIQVYGTGFGPTKPAIPSGQTVATPAPLADLSQLKVNVRGAPATVQWAGLVAPGLYQLNVVVPLIEDGTQFMEATIGGQSTGQTLSIPVVNAGRIPATLTVTPNNRTIRCGGTLALAAAVANTYDAAVSWQVNGVDGGSSAVGTVTAAGLYTAPAVLPSGATVTITAISHFDPTVKASVTVNLQNAVPVVTAVTPNPLAPGAATLTVTGTGFAKDAAIYYAGAALPTTFVSDTKLTASATLAVPVGRLAAVKVANPNPGAATSAPVAIPVRPAAEKLAYADAVRFLRLAAWGASPRDVADLQANGIDAWLAAQFAKPASKWPDPNTTTETVGRLQTAFWNIALAGDDQLRQRAAFALSQILVVSAAKDTQFQQMVPYVRLLGDSAFGSYKDLLAAITLHPAMGDYLDMVNNDKANATTGTAPNENYARELMQLFSLGLAQLDPQGIPIPSAAPEYDQSTVADVAKVMTGWTYAPTPGFGSIWKNMPYYFAPMVAFDDHHDTTEKRLNLPVPCVIPPGGTAASDLSAALDCILQQPNVAPFVSYRLIQRFVMSDPPAAYVGRVAGVFQSSKGDLTKTLAAVLTDPVAQTESSGKLVEPILYATGLLRALDAKITAPDSLTAQATAMGQTPLAPGTVFSFFLPGYRIPSLPDQPVAPEFQALNDATALARANFAWRVVTNGLSSGIVVDTANLQDLATNPADLVEALNQALYAGQMDSKTRDVLVAAASGSTNLLNRVRSALYAAAAAPQYQVQR